MKGRINRQVILSVIFLFLLLFYSCGNSDHLNNSDNGNANGDESSGTYDVDLNGIPQFAGADYIELNKIQRISKFRSDEGHDYSDEFESCRSMKHYFKPYDSIDWSQISIFSPIHGTVSRMQEEWAGTQVQIQSDLYPAFFIIIFHVHLIDSFEVGDQVAEGQQLGNHIGLQTMSDIAVGVSTPGGWKLVSYFDIMTDQVFQNYKSRGIDSRNEVIISRDERDADPLNCNGEEFTTESSLESWVLLDPP